MVLEKTKEWITQSSMPSGLTRGWAMTNGEGLDYPVKPAPEGINRGPGNDRNKRYITMSPDLVARSGQMSIILSEIQITEYHR